MKKITTFIVCCLSLVAVGWSAYAAPASKTKPAATKPAATTGMKCPICKTMVMTTKKTQVNTRMVKVNGKTMYCCDDCNMKTKM